MTDIKKGDRVKVTIEGEATYAGETWLTVDHSHDIERASASIEKIEPPVGVFKPGDVVRSRHNSNTVVALSGTGYTYVGIDNPGLHLPYEKAQRKPEDFTAEDWEKVDLR